MMPPLDSESAARLWSDFTAKHPEHADAEHPFEQFGDSPELADELLALVLHGPKRATAAAVVEFRAKGEPLPRVGGHWIVADGGGQAQAILRSVELRVGPLVSVDDAFAWDEGEGDRSRDWWLDAHRSYFDRTCKPLGVAVTDKLEVVFERFVVVWPEAYA